MAGADKLLRRSPLALLYASKMREEMHNFIHHHIVDLASFAKQAAQFLGHEFEVDVTTHAKAAALFLGDFHWAKSGMHDIASLMNIDWEVDKQLSDDTRNAEILSTSTDHLPLISNEIKHSLLYRLISEMVLLVTNRHTDDMQRRHTDSMSCTEESMSVMDCSMPANWKAEHAHSRERFLKRAELLPPPMATFRMIDIEATCSRNGDQLVVLVDYGTWVQHVGYTAISHTYGMPVYKVFDCQCASECSSKIVPRCSDTPCPHQDASSAAVGAGSREEHKRVVNDVLRMCDILRNAGVVYAWHDGVCIAQHNEEEVKETIMHMGWIYASAKETVIFLHYVGNPMAPIRSSNVQDELGCRWHNRVWTLQEGAFSKSRRYCVQSVAPLGECQSLEEFEEKIALCDSSGTIEIMEEERFFELLKEIDRVVTSLLCSPAADKLLMPHECDAIIKSTWMRHKAQEWQSCVRGLLRTLRWTCFEFVSIEKALVLCSSRNSKHVGDRMNSVLALAEVKDFVADKGERDTIEFFKRQCQRSLARALFSTNPSIYDADRQYILKERQHTWPPILWRELVMCQDYDDLLNCIGFKVLEDGRMELRGDLVCLKAQFTTKELSNEADGGPTSALDAQAISPHHDVAYLAMDLYFDWQTVDVMRLSCLKHLV